MVAVARATAPTLFVCHPELDSGSRGMSAIARSRIGVRDDDVVCLVLVLATAGRPTALGLAETGQALLFVA